MTSVSRRAVLAGSLAFAASAFTYAIATASDPDEYFEGRTDGVAINGTDPVAYFKEGKPVAGQAAHSYEWGGTTWYFASAENRADFARKPEAFAPQYNGFCAYGVAKGTKVKTEPEAWSIIEGKLYLNYDKNVQRLFNEDPRGFIATANEKWPKVR